MSTQYDFAIVYFGLTRSVKKTHESHKKYIFDILQKQNLTYKTFMHTWKIKDGTQNIRDTIISKKIDYEEYKLLSPHFYKLDDEDEFLKSIDMGLYFYKHVVEKSGDLSEWSPKMVSNHVCMLESQKRGLSMIKQSVLDGSIYKYIIFIRPDLQIYNEIPLEPILTNPDIIHIPFDITPNGINDQCAIMNYEYAQLYGNRIDELAEFRKNHGRIVGEEYCKFILSKYNMKINLLDFKIQIIRP
jgi:hypothetical protein